MTPTQADLAIFTFQSQGYSDELRVVRFNGSEGISELFHFGIQLAARDPDVDLDAIVGLPAQLDIHHGDETRSIYGIVNRFEQGAASGIFTPYFAELVPTVWTLTQRAQSRIFQHLNVQDIVRKVLTDAKVKSDHFRFALQRSDYVKRDYCVQYRETDWNFIARLLEEEGIFYFFEHKDGKDVLVMADSSQVHVPIAGNKTVVFRDPTGLVEAEEFIHDFRYSQHLRPGKVTLRDFNFERPTLDLMRDESAARNPELEIYDYPGLYQERGPGGQLARVRKEATQTRRLMGVGQSICRRLIPGCLFTMSECPRGVLNQEYLLIWVQHEGSQPLGQDEAAGRFAYDNRFRCIPSGTPFRPLRKTPKPVVEGSQTAVVTGPAGEEIYTDKYGRVKVHFFWDREGKSDDTASCWIRVAQLWAGSSWGAMFIPRIGHEVIVDFLEGDPDRPIITGRVYNGDNMPPYGLDAEKTKSTIKSNSSKGGGGFNEYRFEDKKGSEEIYQHGQKDLTIVTENDKNQSTGHDETLKIGHDRSKEVGNNEKTKIGVDRTETVGSNESITIGANRTENVGGNENITISGNRTENVTGNESITIGGSRGEKVGGNESIQIGGSRSEQVGGAEKITVGASRKTQIGASDKIQIGANHVVLVGGNEKITIGGSMVEKVGGKVKITADGPITLQSGGAKIMLKPDGTININGKDITIKGSGKITAKASGNMTLKGQKILEN
ncbi:MAG: type VI secretion system tip protein TssI/VgrG [Candidatus Zixiibacteriota bacterium]